MKLPRATRLLIVFAREDDARRVLDVLPKRMEKYGLTIHPQKSRLADFRSPETEHSAEHDKENPKGGTFDFLGFTHYWGRSRRGNWVVKHKTARSRIRRTLDAFWAWCRKPRHDLLNVQQWTLKRKLLGHYATTGSPETFTVSRGFTGR